MWLALEESGALTRRYLKLPEGVSESECEAIASMFGNVKDFTSFALGDLLVYARNHHGEDFVVSVMEATGMAHQTCENLMSVCRQIAPSVRREELRFHVHAVVAPLPPNDQRHYLKLAVDNQWTRQQLRDAIYGPPVLPPAVTGDLTSVARDVLAGAKPMMDGWLITRDSYVRLKAVLEGEA